MFEISNNCSFWFSKVETLKTDQLELWLSVFVGAMHWFTPDSNNNTNVEHHELQIKSQSFYEWKLWYEIQYTHYIGFFSFYICIWRQHWLHKICKATLCS